MDAEIRNIAFVGPAGAGKTTLLESLLFVTGAIGRKGRVADGTSLGDSSPEARSRHMSTEISTARLMHHGVRLTLLDCPGSAELCYEARAAVLGADLAVLVVEPQVERLITAASMLHHLDAHRIPHLVFVNKMDRSEERFRDILSGLRRMSQRPVVPHQYAIGRRESLVGYIDLVTEEAFAYRRNAPADPIPLPSEYREREQAARTELLETLADFDDELLTELLEERRPSEDHLVHDLRTTLGADQVVPVFMGVAEEDMGVRALLDAIIREAPDHTERARDLGIEAHGPALVQMLKTWYLPHTGKLSLARVWRGTVREGTVLGGMRVGGIVQLMGPQPQPLAEAGAGSIVAIAKLEEARTGSVLAEGALEPLSALPTSPVPRPMFSLAVQAASRADEVKLSAAFAKLVDEDPSLCVEQDAELHQTLLRGQGEIHLKIALDRLSGKYNVRVTAAAPRTAYRETIRHGTQAHGRHKKQSGGHGQFADVKIEIAPLPRGHGFRFENKVVGGAIPRQFIPAVEAGAREFMSRGPLGFPVVDVAVTLHDGQFHAVDSNEMSFKMATAAALREGLPRCGPVLLEPVLKLRVTVPTDATARALQLLSGKRGQILGYEGKSGWSGWDEIQAHLPQGEIQDLVVSLRSLSLGTAWFDWGHDHLQEVPERLLAALVQSHGELVSS